ncbi:MAG: 16S rRNA (guanine(527)-N(7))-methyltransferase RsmG [Bacteroidetes bacterium]|nr:16S rRNA (guanine(527)-N(7))-methyltransferase RsmG [Bacteroidota bacterium]
MDILLKYFSDFTPQQTEQFAALEEHYRDWNQKINVISRKDIDALYERHVLHSLSIAAAFDWMPGTSVIDIGCGGGFPGLPLAIYYPHVTFHLVDSIAKKLTVVNQIAEAIGLQNLTTQHARAESIRDRTFDFAVSRAVAALPELWSWAKPLLKSPNKTLPGNHPPGLICLKGGDLNEEIQQSGSLPCIVRVKDLFPEPFFEDKYLLYLAK